MKKWSCLFVGAVLMALCVSSVSASSPNEGLVDIFDGKTLNGWEGSQAIWSVEDGCITGTTGDAGDNHLTYNQFLIWRDGTVDDFVLEFDIKLSKGGNSGMQFRSWEDPDTSKPHRVYGYQADFDGASTYSGIVYGENYRGILAQRGTKSVIGDDHKPREVERFAADDELKKSIKIEDWNHYQVTAQGFNIIQKINGVKVSELTDEDTQQRRRDGIIAIQVHVGPAMKVQLKNIKLKRLPMQDKKKIVFIGGPKSHGYGLHTHKASFRLMADWLNQYVPETYSVVYNGGWPQDPTAIDNADGVVVFCDGGAGNIMIPHIEALKKRLDKGVGLAVIHYTVEMPDKKTGQFLRDAIGGYFEQHFTVTQWFNAQCKLAADHPILRGIKPFDIDDEWYFNIRFRPDMQGVTPLLSCVPPDNTRQGQEGVHSGNPTVRKELGKTEYVAWCAERPDGGRGFGFTGGHSHWLWGNPNYRKLLLNGVAWTAGATIPTDGIDVPTPSWEELEKNQEYEPNLTPEQIKQWQDRISDWNK